MNLEYMNQYVFKSKAMVIDNKRQVVSAVVFALSYSAAKEAFRAIKEARKRGRKRLLLPIAVRLGGIWMNEYGDIDNNR